MRALEREGGVAIVIEFPGGAEDIRVVAALARPATRGGPPSAGATRIVTASRGRPWSASAASTSGGKGWARAAAAQASRKTARRNQRGMRAIMGASIMAGRAAA